MEKLARSQFAKLLLLALFSLLFTPLVSAWMKPFLLLNLLILALGAQSGAFTNFSKKSQEEIPSTAIIFSHKEIRKDEELGGGSVEMIGVDRRSLRKGGAESVDRKQNDGDDQLVKMMQVGVSYKVKKRPSTPSLFFVGDPVVDEREEEENGQNDDDNESHDDDELSAQELFAKAESFIVNFHKELKLQREDD